MHLVADAVSFRYNESQAVLDGINFQISSGTSVALMGPSGSGKTTLLSLIGGTLEPASGTISPSSAELRSVRIGWVFQTVNVFGRRSALENVAVGALLRAQNSRDAGTIALRALEEVGIVHLATVQARKLSGGELQRVVIARAIAAESVMILADEPTGQLDHANSELVVDCLLRKRTIDSTVVIATHDPQVAHRCDFVMRLEGGKLHKAQ